MSEGLAGAHKEGGEGPQAGGMPTAAAPTAKKFFLLEYFDEVRKGITWMRTSPKPDQPLAGKVVKGLTRWTKLKKARIGMAFTITVMVLAWGLFGVQAAGTAVVNPGGGAGPGPTGHNATAAASGTVSENGQSANEMQLEATHLATLNVTVSWTDEPAGVGLTNQPDQIGLSITAPNGKNWTVGTTTVSPVRWSLNDTAPDYGPGKWNFTVVGGNMGDISRAGGGLFCPRCSADNSNTYQMSVSYTW